MSKLVLYDPSMCCPSGMCGVTVDEETIRVATVLHAFKKHGVEVKRFNLTANPMEYLTQPLVNQKINEEGVDCLPITLFNDQIIYMGRYPTNKELCELVGLSEDIIPKREKKVLSVQQGVM